jgi:prepilin peptidase CpaA
VSFVLAMLILLMAGAWCDIATRTIPDAVSLLLLPIGGLARVLEGPSAVVFSVLTAFLLFILLMIAYARELIGGGDVKLMSAFAVGLSPLDSYHFFVATVIAGGVLGVAYLLLSRGMYRGRPTKSISLLRRVIAIECWRIRRRRPIPYGVAIAVGGAFVVLLHSGSF